VPQLKRHVAIEIAFERVLTTTFPKEAEVPADARCYICLDGGDTLLRGCACRGASGWAHVDCLAEMAVRDEFMTVEGRGQLSRFVHCPTCHQTFTGLLLLEMHRRMWRRYRDAPASDHARKAFMSVVLALINFGEEDAANELREEALRGLPRDHRNVLEFEVLRAEMLFKSHPDKSHEMLDGLRERMQRCDDASVRSRFESALAVALTNKGRVEEALPFAARGAKLAVVAHGPESMSALGSLGRYAGLLFFTGRADESRSLLTRLLATKTRVLGADHPDTKNTKATIDRLFPS